MKILQKLFLLCLVLTSYVYTAEYDMLMNPVDMGVYGNIDDMLDVYNTNVDSLAMDMDIMDDENLSTVYNDFLPLGDDFLMDDLIAQQDPTEEFNEEAAAKINEIKEYLQGGDAPEWMGDQGIFATSPDSGIETDTPVTPQLKFNAEELEVAISNAVAGLTQKALVQDKGDYVETSCSMCPKHFSTYCTQKNKDTKIIGIKEQLAKHYRAAHRAEIIESLYK